MATFDHFGASWKAVNEIKLGSFFIYKAGLIHRNMKDLSHSGVFRGGQTFCTRSQGVAATFSLFVKKETNSETVTLSPWKFCRLEVQWI